MWEYNSPNELYHHGILGMKWGIRRFQNKDGTLTSAGRKRLKKNSEDSSDSPKNTKTESGSSSSNSKSSTSTKKSVKDMSDAELQDAINRLNLETRYSELTKSDSPSKNNSRAKKFITDVLEQSGKNIATQATTYLMGTATNKLFEKFGFGPDVINPKKGQKDK